MEMAVDQAATLVLLPGMDGTGKLFAPFTAALPAERRAVVIRYPEVMTDYETLAEYIERFLPAEPFALLAESFSGPLGAMLAARHPERVKALIFASSFVSPPLPRLFQAMTGLFFGPATPRWLIKFVMGSKATPDSVLDALTDILREADPQMWKKRLDSVLTGDAREALKETRCPVLVMQGAKDRLLGPGAVFALARTRPCVVMRLSNGPHLLLQSAPEKCAAAVEEFLKRAGL